MYHTRYAKGPAQVLYRIFIQPTLSEVQQTSTKSRITASYPTIYGNQIHSQPIVPSKRTFSTTPPRHVKTRAPEPRAEKWDEEITSQYIYLVNPQTNKLYADRETGRAEPPRSKSDILSQLNKNTHRLVQFPSQEGENDLGFIPVCKIIDKKAVYAEGKRRKAESKDRKKVEAKGRSTKTLELNWAIDGNDLGHRLDRVAQFLSEGRKVEIVLASKKRGRKATAVECEELLEKVRKCVEGVPGAKEFKGMEGKIGGFAVMSFQGKVVQQEAKGDIEGG